MADIVTEQWIQFRHLKQALMGVLVVAVNMLLSPVKKYHLQLQDFVRQEMEKTQLTAFYTSEELVFFLMADIVTEQWIQFRHLEQALMGVLVVAVNMLLSPVKKYHLQLQDFVRQEMEKTQLTAFYTSEELVFFLMADIVTEQWIQFRHLEQALMGVLVVAVNMLLSPVKKYHLQLQDFVRQEMEKTQLTAFYTSEELVFFLMADIVTEQWIQFRHLEQALMGVLVVAVNMLLSPVKKYHLQLQDFVRQEMEKTQLTAFYTTTDYVYIATDYAFIATDYADIATDYAYITTDYAFIATDYLYIATDYAYIATDYSYIATDYAHKS
ncbi:unnamed protein product [Rhodiola kirilowii]